MKKPSAKKIIGGVTTALLVVAFLLALVSLASVLMQTLRGQEASLFGYKMYYVESDSMSPTLEKGDMIISKTIKDVSPNKMDKLIDEGDVVTFKQEVQCIVINNTHRVVKDVYFDEELGAYCVVTRGDNPSAPTDAPIPISAIKAKMIKRTTTLADLYEFLGSTSGIAIVIVLPMGLLLISTIYQLVIKIKKPAQKEEEAPKKESASREEEIKRQAVIDYLKEQAIKEYLEQKNDSNGNQNKQ